MHGARETIGKIIRPGTRTPPRARNECRHPAYTFRKTRKPGYECGSKTAGEIGTLPSLVFARRPDALRRALKVCCRRNCREGALAYRRGDDRRYLCFQLARP